MFSQKKIFFIATIACICTISAFAVEREFKFDSKYLNLPVTNEAPECQLELEVDGEKVHEFTIELSPGKPDFWVYLEADKYTGKNGVLKTLEFSDSQIKGFEAVYQDDTFPGENVLYKEKLRPQFHFSTKRGWNNDANGTVYYNGEYHLFYQHNPFGFRGGNTTWGHAVSTDLVHWEELGDAIYPDELGTIFSGSAVVDWNNTTGFQTGDEPPLICIYTSAGDRTKWSEGKPCTQSIAYSNDRGRTWTKYEGNPVQDHFRTENRDPKVIWWKETKEWVIVLHMEDHYMAFFKSQDLKRWELQSILYEDAFYECPELFQLPVDGDEDNKKWIFYAGHGGYLIGDFDGNKFTPEMKAVRYNYGNCFFASQTFSDILKEDGRRIQMAWGQVDFPDMPFNQMITFPVSLSLHSTEDGLRMFAYPVKEIEKLHGKKYQWRDEDLKPGDNLLTDVKGNLFDIDCEIEVGDADEVGFEVNGFPVVYSVSEGNLEGGFVDEYREPIVIKDSGDKNDYIGNSIAELKPVDGIISLRILVDIPSVDIFGNNGRVYMPMKAVRDLNNKSMKIYAKGGTAHIKKLIVHEMNSIWN